MTNKIIELVKSVCVLGESDINEKTELKNLSLDSLSFVALLVSIEEEFSISFGDEELDMSGYLTVNDLIVQTKKLVNKND